METVIRIALIYFFLMAGFRIIGKREFGQLEPFEFVMLLLIPHLVADALIREDTSLTTAVVAVCTLLSLVFITSVLAYRSKTFATLLEGRGSVLVRHGDLVADNMNLERVSPAEITAEMHKAGLEWLSQVKWAVLETDGKITFVPWDPAEARVKMEKKEVG